MTKSQEKQARKLLKTITPEQVAKALDVPVAEVKALTTKRKPAASSPKPAERDYRALAKRFRCTEAEARYRFGVRGEPIPPPRAGGVSDLTVRDARGPLMPGRGRSSRFL